MVNEVNTQEFNEMIKSGTVVCDFFATWCMPCKMLAPVMEEVSEKFSDKAKFVKVNIDENMELAAEYSVMSIPLVAVFKDGELAAKSLGFCSKSEMTEFFEKYL